ncbi:MAG: hypothetical protein AcusKO_31280 [Acuticoccus sp.]
MIPESQSIAILLGVVTLGATVLAMIGDAPGEWGRGVLLSVLCVVGALYAGSLGGTWVGALVAVVGVVALSIGGLTGLGLATALGVVVGALLLSSGATLAGAVLIVTAACGGASILRDVFFS